MITDTNNFTNLTSEDQRFKQAFDTSPIGMALVSPKGTWLQVNDSLCVTLGYPPEELKQKTFQDITHPDDLDKDLGFVQEMLDGTRHTYQMEKRYFHKKGHVIWAILSVSLVRDDKGIPLYFISQIQDITQVKEANDNIEQLKNTQEKILSAIMSGIYIYNTEKRHNEYINSAYTKITGWTLDEINAMGEAFLDLFHPDDLDNVLDHMTLVTTQETDTPVTLEYRFKTKEGSWIWCYSQDSPFERSEEGNVVTFVGTFIDITRQKEAEIEITKKIEELEKMNQVLVGRELKMIELKKELATLKHATP